MDSLSGDASMEGAHLQGIVPSVQILPVGEKVSTIEFSQDV